jgi:hypothetical protein
LANTTSNHFLFAPTKGVVDISTMHTTKLFAALIVHIVRLGEYMISQCTGYTMTLFQLQYLYNVKYGGRTIAKDELR